MYCFVCGNAKNILDSNLHRHTCCELMAPTDYTSFYALSDFLTNARIPGLMLSRQSLVVLTGFQPIDLDLFARTRKFVPRNVEPWNSYIRSVSNLRSACLLTLRYFTISSSVNVVGSGLSVLPIMVRPPPISLATS